MLFLCDFVMSVAQNKNKKRPQNNCRRFRRRGRDSNSWSPNQARRFSKPVVSATHPPLQSEDTGLYLIVQNHVFW